MPNIEIVVEDSLKEQDLRDLWKMVKGWRLFFFEPEGVEYHFDSPLWGYKWDYTPENLKEIIKEGAKVGDKHKHHICVFRYNGEDMFAWCSWTREVADLHTNVKYPLENGQLATKITELITDLVKYRKENDLIEQFLEL